MSLHFRQFYGKCARVRDLNVFFGYRGDSVLLDPRMSLPPSGVLLINNTSMEDAGLYNCSVLNSNLSITAQLQVFQ